MSTTVCVIKPQHPSFRNPALVFFASFVQFFLKDTDCGGWVSVRPIWLNLLCCLVDKKGGACAEVLRGRKNIFLWALSVCACVFLFVCVCVKVSAWDTVWIERVCVIRHLGAFEWYTATQRGYTHGQTYGTYLDSISPLCLFEREPLCGSFLLDLVPPFNELNWWIVWQFVSCSGPRCHAWVICCHVKN